MMSWKLHAASILMKWILGMGVAKMLWQMQKHRVQMVQCERNIGNYVSANLFIADGKSALGMAGLNTFYTSWSGMLPLCPGWSFLNEKWEYVGADNEMHKRYQIHEKYQIPTRIWTESCSFNAKFLRGLEGVYLCISFVDVNGVCGSCCIDMGIIQFHVQVVDHLQMQHVWHLMISPDLVFGPNAEIPKANTGEWPPKLRFVGWHYLFGYLY